MIVEDGVMSELDKLKQELVECIRNGIEREGYRMEDIDPDTLRVWQDDEDPAVLHIEFETITDSLTDEGA